MKTLLWIIATPFIILALYALLRFAFCRPNYFVVKTATPMVEKIADYIVEHGLPESLDAIPNLYYEIKNCKKKNVYWNGHKIVNDLEKTEWIEVEERCNLVYEDKKYKIFLRLTKFINKPYDEGRLSIKFSKTHLGTNFSLKNGKLVHSDIGSGFDNRFGFCQQFKQ